MTNRRLKKSVVYGIYCLGLIILIAVIYIVESNMPKKPLQKKEEKYVSKTIFDDVIPVVQTEEKIIKPFNADDVVELKKFYDYKSDQSLQEKSIIYYENTYMQSNGTLYGKDSKFDVISILPGTVEDITDDELLGKVIKIKHNDNLTSIYECLTEVTINKGDTVLQGQIIGTSGPSKINTEKNNQVYIELIYKNETVNPENYYGKTLKELEK